MNYCYHPSPLGPLLLVGDASGLWKIGFPEGKGKVEPSADWVESTSGLETARQQLDEYFAGDRQTFDLKLKPQGTDFQLQVLAALQTIPFGNTASYADVAEQIGRPKAVRAVGAANGRNPLPIVIPCHRVIGANGSLTGFGGGMEAKSYLLTLEGALPATKNRDLFEQANNADN